MKTNVFPKYRNEIFFCDLFALQLKWHEIKKAWYDYPHFEKFFNSFESNLYGIDLYTFPQKDEYKSGH